jgi:hypothetical protein
MSRVSFYDKNIFFQKAYVLWLTILPRMTATALSQGSTSSLN